MTVAHKNFRAFLLASMILPLLALPSYAQTYELVKQDNMNFGLIEFDTGYSGTIRLGTNGSTVVTGTNITQGGTPNAGHIQVTTTDIGVIEVRCDPTATMSAGAGQKLTVNNIEVSPTVGVPFGSGATCNGTKKNSTPALLIDLGSTPNPNIFIGGEVDVTGQTLQPTGDYTSAAGGGKSLTIDVVFQ